MTGIAKLGWVVAALCLAGAVAHDAPIGEDSSGARPAQQESANDRPAPPLAPVPGGGQSAAGEPERQGPPDQGPGQRDWRGDRGGFRLTPENREHVLAVIGDLRPLSDEERERLVAMSFEELRKVLAEQGGMILGLARLRETQPELYDLRIADMKLLRRIQEHLQHARMAREANEPVELAAAEAQVRAAVAEQIDLRFAIREREITALEERVAGMRQELERERQQPRDELISRRLEMFESGGERSWSREGEPGHRSGDNDARDENEDDEGHGPG